jgi:hypothetical protein
MTDLRALAERLRRKEWRYDDLFAAADAILALLDDVDAARKVGPDDIELVERLDMLAGYALSDERFSDARTAYDAKGRITALRSERDRLREALERCPTPMVMDGPQPPTGLPERRAVFLAEVWTRWADLALAALSNPSLRKAEAEKPTCTHRGEGVLHSHFLFEPLTSSRCGRCGATFTCEEPSHLPARSPEKPTPEEEK